jgi:hypothetical protein
VLFGLRICTSVAPRTSPEASAGRLLELGCSSGYRANRQFPGRDFHPLAFETQEVSLQSGKLRSHQTSLRVALPDVSERDRRHRHSRQLLRARQGSFPGKSPSLRPQNQALTPLWPFTTPIAANCTRRSAVLPLPASIKSSKQATWRHAEGQDKKDQATEATQGRHSRTAAKAGTSPEGT